MRPEQSGIKIGAAILCAGTDRSGKSSPKVIWGVVKDACSKCDMPGVASDDLRRYAGCGTVDDVRAPLSRQGRWRVETDSVLLGHVIVETTERYPLQATFPERR